MTPSPELPAPRGPISAGLLDAIRRSPGRVVVPAVVDVPDPGSDDVQLALYVAYELRYRGFAGVDPGWELSLIHI